MFGIKKYIWNKYYLQPLNNSQFPEKAKNALVLWYIYFELKSGLIDFKKTSSIAHLLSYCKKNINKIWADLLAFNPNNIGNWSIEKQKSVTGSRLFEKNLIKKMINLYNADDQKIEGYCTSGTTEANIYMSWLGRNYFQKNKKAKINEIILLKTDLSHYSISKSANIVGVQTKTICLNEKTWGMDAESFQKIAAKLIKKGKKYFLLPFTLGYTGTGTSDDYSLIIKKIKILKKRHVQIDFFCWIDAALNGLIIPFAKQKFKPFNSSYIKGFATDFHKFAGLPMPSGLLLYRSNLRKLIEQPVDYLKENDNTLLGSRTGIAPIAIWFFIQKNGRKWFRKKINKNLKEKNAFLQKYKHNKNITIIDKNNLLNIAIIVNPKAKKLRKELENQLHLLFKKTTIKFRKTKKTLLMAKAFFIK